MKRYAILGGISNPFQLKAALNHISFEHAAKKIDAIVLNGDLSSQVPEIEIPNHLNKVFYYLKYTEMDVFVLPGFNERVSSFEPALAKAMTFNPHIKDARNNFILNNEDSDLMFIPGHENNNQNNYVHGMDNFPSGNYTVSQGIWRPTPQENVNSLNRIIKFYNLKDIAKKIRRPRKTVVISPYSQAFNSEYGIDTIVGMFNHFTKEYIYNPIFQNKRKISQLKELNPEKNYEYVSIGSTSLKLFLELTSITKSISTNSTINTDIANYSTGQINLNKESQFDIHFNSGRLEFGLGSIVSIEGEHISYKPFSINHHLRLLADQLRHSKSIYN